MADFKKIYCPICTCRWENLQALQEVKQEGLYWTGKCPGCGTLFKGENDLWKKGLTLIRPDWHSWVYGSGQNPIKGRKNE